MPETFSKSFGHSCRSLSWLEVIHADPKSRHMRNEISRSWWKFEIYSLCVKWPAVVVERVTQDWALCSSLFLSLLADFAVPHLQYDSHFSYFVQRQGLEVVIICSYHVISISFCTLHDTVRYTSHLRRKGEKRYFNLKKSIAAKRFWPHQPKFSADEIRANERRRRYHSCVYTMRLVNEKRETYLFNGNAWQGKIFHWKKYCSHRVLWYCENISMGFCVFREFIAATNSMLLLLAAIFLYLNKNHRLFEDFCLRES